MAVDASIPLQLRGLGPQQGPLDLFGKQIGVMSGLAGLQAQQAQLAQLRRQQQEQDALREVVAGSNGDWNAVSQSLLSLGMIDPALKVQGMLAQQQQQQTAAKKAQLDYDMKMADATREVFGRMAADPTEQGIIAGANELVSRQILDAPKVDAMIQRAMSMPEGMRAQWLAAQSNHINAILDAKFPKPTEFERIGNLAGLSPEQVRAGAAAKFAKDQQFAPPQTVITMGAPQMMTDASGTPVAVQFPNRPGEQPQVTKLPGLKPQAGSQQHLTESEAKGTLFLSQMDSAEKEIGNIVGAGFDPSSNRNQIATRLAGSDWTNWLAPKNAQRYAQASEQWAEAYLRMKTGAATNRDEIVRNARAYFPQPGDKPDVIAQKNAMRRQAISDMEFVAGRGAEQVKARKAQQASQAGWKIEEVK